MTDEERRDDAEIQDHLKKVYGFSEEQLLKEVERAEKSVSDSDFPGAEERIFQKLMERKAKEEKTKKSVEKDKVEPKELLPSVTEVENPEPETKEPTESEEKEPEKKKVRFRKKSIFLAAAVAAILALMLGSTAIGEKNYFLRPSQKEKGFVLNNDKYVSELGNLSEAYKTVEDQLGIPVLKMVYIPDQMNFESVSVTKERATFVFNYKENKVYFVQEIYKDGTSKYLESDRKKKETVSNEWLNLQIDIYYNELSDGKVENEIQLYIKDCYYAMSAIMDADTFKEIVKNLNIY